MRIHESLTPARILDLAESSMMDGDYRGACLACGEESEDPVEPDARGYPCGVCGAPRVYGAEELLLMTA